MRCGETFSSMHELVTGAFFAYKKGKIYSAAEVAGLVATAMAGLRKDLLMNLHGFLSHHAQHLVPSHVARHSGRIDVNIPSTPSLEK